MHVIDLPLYQKLFFKAFDHKCAITTSHHIFLQNNYFCKAPLKAAFVWKIWENSQANKKSSMLPINSCTKNLDSGRKNFPKFICKNIFQSVSVAFAGSSKL